MVQKIRKRMEGDMKPFQCHRSVHVNYNQVKYFICIASKIEFGVNKEVTLWLLPSGRHF